MANGTEAEILGEGKIKIENLGILHGVLYCPSLSINILSVPCLMRQKYDVLFSGKKDAVFIDTPDGRQLSCPCINTMYYVRADCRQNGDIVNAVNESVANPKMEAKRAGKYRDSTARPPSRGRTAKMEAKRAGNYRKSTARPPSQERAAKMENRREGKNSPTSPPLQCRNSRNKTLSHSDKCIHAWHRRMGHMNFRYLEKMQRYTIGMEIDKCDCFLDCAVCAKNKQKSAPVSKKSAYDAEYKFQTIAADLVGPFKNSKGQNKYFLHVIDHFTRYSYIYLLKSKDQAFENLKNCINYIERQFPENKVRSVMTDRGLEFVNEKMRRFLKERGIRHLLSPAYTPTYNSICERRGQLIQNVMRCLLEDAGLKFYFWGEAVTFAVYLINRSYTEALQCTPFEKLYGRKPNLTYLRLFGCSATLLEPLRRKSGRRTKTAIFLGIRGSSYRFLTENQEVVHTRNARFHENKNWSSIHSNEIFFPSFYPAGTGDQSQQQAAAGKNGDDLSADGQESQKGSGSSESHSQTGSDNGWTDDDDESDEEAETPPDDDQPDDFSSCPHATGHELKTSPKDVFPLPSTGTKDPQDGDVKPIKDDDSHGNGGVTLRRSGRERRPPDRYGFNHIAAPTLIYNCKLIDNVINEVPSDFKSVQTLPADEKLAWNKAMQAEIMSLRNLNVFEKAELPSNKKAIGSKWVFKLKHDNDGKPIYKARLVAQGCSQSYSDFQETYAPTTKSESLRLALVNATLKNLNAWHFDVSTAYLHADLQETDLYMKAAPGFGAKDEVWRLRRSIYGLRQSARNWHCTLAEKLISMGFENSKADLCIFTRLVKDVKQVCLIYVDDILFFCRNEKEAVEFEKQMCQQFAMKNLGLVKRYLSVDIEKTEKGYKLSQIDKIKQLLDECKMSDSKPVSTPMTTNFLNECKNDTELFENNFLYRSVIGSLNYLASNTRPDIQMAVNILSRFVNEPRMSHWNGLKRILRYLKGTMYKKLILEPEITDELQVETFSDADWGSDPETYKSISGNVIFINACPIYWKAKQQKHVSLSTAESEVAAVSDLCCILEVFKILINDVICVFKQPFNVNEDNQAAIELAKPLSTRSRSRHINLRYANVQECVKNGLIEMKYCPTEENVADLFTKPLDRVKHEFFCDCMKLY